MEIKTVAIVGAGALGILLADTCKNVCKPEEIIFIADENRVKRYQVDGLYCNGNKLDCSYFTKEQAREVDLLVFAVKANALEAAITEAAPFVGEKTTIISLLNGVTSEEIIGKTLGEEKIIYAVAQGMSAVREGSAVFAQMPGEYRIGIPKGATEREARLSALAAFLTKIGYRHTVDEDILWRMWGKLMLNVGVNQSCMVHETDYGGLQRAGAPRETMISAMDETRAVAASRGIIISEKDRNDYVALLDSLTPGGMPSMRQDALAKRLSEVGLFAGTVIALAEQYGCDVPVNRWLFRRIHEMEAAYSCN